MLKMFRLIKICYFFIWLDLGKLSLGRILLLPLVYKRIKYTNIYTDCYDYIIILSVLPVYALSYDDNVFTQVPSYVVFPEPQILHKLEQNKPAKETLTGFCKVPKPKPFLNCHQVSK